MKKRSVTIVFLIFMLLLFILAISSSTNFFENIKDNINANKIVNSDNSGDMDDSENVDDDAETKHCWNCFGPMLNDALVCPYCGMDNILDAKKDPFPNEILDLKDFIGNIGDVDDDNVGDDHDNVGGTGDTGDIGSNDNDDNSGDIGGSENAKICSQCFTALSSDVVVCPVCGAGFDIFDDDILDIG